MKIHGPDHPLLAPHLGQIASELATLGRADEALATNLRALAINERTSGKEHVATATRHFRVGEMLRDRGDLAGAITSFQRALTLDEGALGPDHPIVSGPLMSLAQALERRGDLPGALEAARAGPIHEGVNRESGSPPRTRARRTSVVHEARPAIARGISELATVGPTGQGEIYL